MVSINIWRASNDVKKLCKDKKGCPPLLNRSHMLWYCVSWAMHTMQGNLAQIHNLPILVKYPYYYYSFTVPNISWTTGFLSSETVCANAGVIWWEKQNFGELGQSRPRMRSLGQNSVAAGTFWGYKHTFSVIQGGTQLTRGHSKTILLNYEDQ